MSANGRAAVTGRGLNPRLRICVSAAAAALFAMGASAGSAGASFPGRNGRIAFDEDVAGHGYPSLFSVASSGRGLRRIAGTPATAPAWSADGRQLAFSSEAGNTFGALFVSRADGANARKIAAPCGRARARTCGNVLADPTWAPDGRRLAFIKLIGDCAGPPGLVSGCDPSSAGDVGYALEVINRDGTHRHTLFTIRSPAQPLIRLRPAWSADGQTIVYAKPTRSQGTDCAGSALWTIRPDGTHHHLLIQTCRPGLRFASAPDWSPDGRHIAFTARSGGLHDRLVGNIYVVDRLGGHLRRVTSNKPPPAGCLPCPALSTESPSWSPNGKSLAYAAPDGLWTVSASGGHRRQVIQAPRIIDPAWRPLR